MPSMLDATKSLLTAVKSSFGDHGELSNPEHPLYQPVADADAAMAELEQMTQDRPVPPKPEVIRNPANLTVVLERPTGIDRDLQVCFTEKGLKLVVLDTSVDPPAPIDERDFEMGALLTADGTIAFNA